MRKALILVIASVLGQSNVSLMRFSDDTRQHFHLYKSGGSLDCTPLTPPDTNVRDKIRSQLKGLTHKFQKGLLPDAKYEPRKAVPGSATIRKLHKEIDFVYQDLPMGGRIKITTGNPKALSAIHEFLKFEIKLQHTGDSGKIEKT